MSDGTGCSAAMMDMLAADPDELRGEGDTPLARHLRACATCAAAAARILDAQQELADAIAILTAASPQAGHAMRHDPLPTCVRERAAPGRRAYARRLGIPGVSALLTAAALVLILLQRSRDDPTVREPLTDRIGMAMAVPVVSVTEGDDVAIMHTANPNITVVWYLKRESQ